MFDSLYSVVNWALVYVGLSRKGLPWLSDPYLAMLAIIIVNTWRGLPFFAITVLPAWYRSRMSCTKRQKRMAPDRWHASGTLPYRYCGPC
jgi:hypothetical protein